jgi:hypothetical protein
MNVQRNYHGTEICNQLNIKYCLFTMAIYKVRHVSIIKSSASGTSQQNMKNFLVIIHDNSRGVILNLTF